ncbi:hypothetical protein FOA43_000892 [Brettanomyces nanus]|uniref:Rhodanese domain-containing protein n=1 Tax=Eeniella nana TaxID=13502 RepID=A0A875RNF7_EENNA|nr:uncharacterized protein FOA43_000892 [Brettanomyces nanus]QPG73580.1 hypothetical protein FOA43_000892 [Brettanomyces nanus]
MSFRAISRQTSQILKRTNLKGLEFALPRPLLVGSVRSLSTVQHQLPITGQWRGSWQPLVGFSINLLNRRAVRYYSVIEEESSAPVIDFNKMKDIAAGKDSTYVIVDVREPDEYKTGHIPNAINVPCKSSPGAYGLNPEEFHLTFGFEKPAKDKTLVFYCMGGIRSSISEELAGTCDYSKRLNYKGSWEDWVANRGAIEYSPEPESAESTESTEPSKSAEPKDSKN